MPSHIKCNYQIKNNNVKFYILSSDVVPYNKYYKYSTLSFGYAQDIYYDYWMNGYKHYYEMPILHISNNNEIKTKTSIIQS